MARSMKPLPIKLIQPGDILCVATGSFGSVVLGVIWNTFRVLNPVRWWNRLFRHKPILIRYQHMAACCEPDAEGTKQVIHGTFKRVIHEPLSVFLSRYRKILILRRRGLDVKAFVFALHAYLGHEYNEWHLFLHALGEALGFDELITGLQLNKTQRAIVCSTVIGLGFRAAGIKKINGHKWYAQDPNDAPIEAKRKPHLWRVIGRR